MQLSKAKIEGIMAQQNVRAREVCQRAGVSEPWFSDTVTRANLGFDFTPKRARTMADALQVEVGDILADVVENAQAKQGG